MIHHRCSATVQVAADRWLAFHDPVLVLQADAPDAVRHTLSDVEQLTRDRGLHAVGYVTYEAAAAFGLPASAGAALPLVWFAFFDAAGVRPTARPRADAPYTVGPLTPSADRPAFEAAFSRIRAHLAAGDCYQANYTFRLDGAFAGDVPSFFADLCDAQRGRYAACIDLGDRVICSASPELFFAFEGADVVARPMKGTCARGRTADEDLAAGRTLSASAKDRAENVMVVDMIRNDLGRVAEVGSVEVPALFTAERYPTLWQLTSTVRARSAASLADVFAALHPSASITGAPKQRAMEILQGLETGPRGIYTGAIGHVPPDGLAQFNVAIRTAVIDRRAGTLSFGVGSGIVWDSDADAEYAECLLKASVIGRPPIVFDLLETLRWTPGEGYYLLERHLARLHGSADYFDIEIAPAAVIDALAQAVADAPSSAWRVRLLVAQDGTVRTERQPYERGGTPVTLRLCPWPVDTSDRFLYHKTTCRAVYERARAAVADSDDVLLWNEADEVTEATTANIVVDLDGRRVTPPVSSGLLPGTCRAELLASGAIEERRLTIEDVRRSTRLCVINSVHGEREARLRV